MSRGHLGATRDSHEPASLRSKACSAIFTALENVLGGSMRRRAFGLGCLLLYWGTVVSGLAQEGHPLTGTWSGDWGPKTTERNHLTVVMNWDGKSITGTINPGP